MHATNASSVLNAAATSAATPGARRHQPSQHLAGLADIAGWLLAHNGYVGNGIRWRRRCGFVVRRHLPAPADATCSSVAAASAPTGRVALRNVGSPARAEPRARRGLLSSGCGAPRGRRSGGRVEPGTLRSVHESGSRGVVGPLEVVETGSRPLCVVSRPAPDGAARAPDVAKQGSENPQRLRQPPGSGDMTASAAIVCAVAARARSRTPSSGGTQQSSTPWVSQR